MKKIVSFTILIVVMTVFVGLLYYIYKTDPSFYETVIMLVKTIKE